MFIAALFLTAFTCTQPGKVYASANLTAYLSVPPTGWEPMGYNQTGTAPWYVVQTLGWTPVRVMGNVGVGDGSTGTLNRSSNQAINYSPNNYMAADVSMAPWDPGRITSPGGSAPVVTNANNTAPENTNVVNAPSTSGNNTSATVPSTAGNNTISIPNIGNITLTEPRKISFDNNTTSAPGNASNETANQTTLTNAGSVSFNKPLNDPYHPITMGRPIDDLLYEYPLAQTITMYSRLTGLMMPNGCPANIGIRCCGYGY